MPISYIEKGYRLHAAVRAAGHSLWEENGVWKSSNDAVVQAIIDNYNDFADYKADRIAAIKADGLARIQAVFPAINSFDELALIRDLFLSILPAARSPTANWQRMIDIYTAGRKAVIGVNNATTKQQVDAVNPAWPV